MLLEGFEKRRKAGGKNDANNTTPVSALVCFHVLFFLVCYQKNIQFCFVVFLLNISVSLSVSFCYL